MKDRSQIDDMRAALRGDLERARRRGAGNLLQPETEVAPEAADTPEPEPVAAEPAPEVPPEPKPEPIAAEHEPEPVSKPERTGLFRSLFRRR